MDCWMVRSLFSRRDGVYIWTEAAFMWSGKWDQMMAQTHTDYSYWQEPTQNM